MNIKCIVIITQIYFFVLLFVVAQKIYICVSVKTFNLFADINLSRSIIKFAIRNTFDICVIYNDTRSEYADNTIKVSANRLFGIEKFVNAINVLRYLRQYFENYLLLFCDDGSLAIYFITWLLKYTINVQLKLIYLGYH